ncbi:Retroelement [Phytophthora megakarya]|uniref:Retroelement n=1 Tax=Phytophthora megakarya TaxID=4795 RepID=A0A225VSA2_9STRA|nr:Retroelement [Phytophthora megakarya]
MEVDNVNFRQISREDCRKRNLCFRCKRPGHRMNDCIMKSSYPMPNRYGRQSSNSVQVLETSRTNTSSVEPLSFRNYSVNIARVHRPVQPGVEHNLIHKKVMINGYSLLALIDCGANHNLLRPGIACGPAKEHVTSVESFDGSVRRDVRLGEVTATVTMGGMVCSEVTFTEYELPASHDVILGKPWLTKFNPRINWQTNEMKIASSLFAFPDISAAYFDVPITTEDTRLHEFVAAPHDFNFYHVKVTAAEEDGEHSEKIKRLLDEFKDVFPAVLPPERSVEFELNLEADARPSSRAPFRLSKTEQEALQGFVDDLLEKQWIEISDSPYVSIAFGIPKRDRKTGKQQSRREWIRSGNPTAPVRWVVDYRYLNSQTLVPKIPLPNIEELFDQMARVVVFSVIDLAQGYHQMRVKPACRPYTAFRTGTETYH